ncbi:S-layer homology domain-containing protein [Paenibacillus polygoni]|uniref:S-layer homology domain-containing protein n=1 Tax=Paenibacillus polygoni TaxID=3050112 RepID=A0ABY8WXQ7_9BACL|nr:S-layer homology domain-containing protein [Paenibacillus polygoni]WIV17895.1 S-layer homology domain-containing protein [Paenibacillus polygoni]
MTFKTSNINSIPSKKMVSAMLASLMALSAYAGVAGAETAPVSVTVKAATGMFSDVKSGYWAEKHIYKLASQNILLGNNGLFRPGDAVTQQEAITMAIRFVNKESELPAADKAKLPTGISTSNYFKSYVSLAFDLGLVNEKEEANAKIEKGTWGEKKASREWITKLLIRAIDKEAQAKAAGNAPTNFADNDKISNGLKGYVSVAVDLNIAQGISGNKFNPTGNVTRAQLATFFSRGGGYKDYSYAGQHKGYITELTDSKITLYTGSTYVTYTRDANTPFFTSTSELRINAADIALYSEVMVAGKNQTATYVESLDNTPKTESVEGSFERLSGNKLWLFAGDTYQEYTFTDKTVFYDQNENVVKAADLTAGSVIEIQRETFTAQKNPVAVRVKSGVVNKTATGKVQSVDSTSKTVTVVNDSGTTDVLKIQDGISVIRYQNEIVALSELKIGTAVKYTIKDSIAQSIEITAGVERTVRGTLYELGANHSTVTYMRDGGSLEVKILASNPQIVISGIEQPIISDLLADGTSGDVVEITLNSNEEVTKIEVLNRQMERVNLATVVSYNNKTKLLTVLDANKKPQVFTLDEKTKLEYNTTSPTLTGIEPYLTEGRKVNLNTIGTRALSLSIIYKYEGTVTELSTSAKNVKLLQTNGESITLPYQTTPSVELYGKSSASLSDVKAGDQITAMLGANQDVISKIYVKSAVQFELQSLNLSTYRAEVKKDGATSQIYVDKLTITGDNGAALKPADLKLGSLINVSFDGNTPQSIQVVKQTWGEISNISGNTVTYKTATGSSESVNTNKVKVVKNGSTSTTLSSLTAADHVILTQDADGTPVFHVLSPVSKSFWTYSASSNELQVKRTSTTDTNYRFQLSPNVYIHQGDHTLSVQSLKDNDNIVLYLLNNVVVEISKP